MGVSGVMRHGERRGGLAAALLAVLSLAATTAHAWPKDATPILRYGPASADTTKLVREVQPRTPATLQGAKLPPNYLTGFLDLGTGAELIESQAKLLQAWNTSAGIARLVAADATQAPVTLPARFKSGSLNKLLANLVILYYATWQGVESARREYYRQVEELQLTNMSTHGIAGLTASPIWGPQFVPARSKGSGKWLNSWYTNDDGEVGNGVTAYSQTYLDLSNGPLIMTFPAITDYFLINFYNFYGEVVHTLGTIAKTKGATKVLVVDAGAPKSPLESKFAADHIVRMPGVDGIVLSRILGAPRSKEFTIEAAEPGKKLATDSYWWGTDPAVYYIFPQRGFDPLYYWRVAALVLARNPRQGLTPELKAVLQELHFGPDGLDVKALTPDQQTALIAAIPIASQGVAQSFYMIGPKSHGYWYTTTWNSIPGSYYQQNAAYFKAFWIANVIENAAYLLQFVDSQARPLTGRFDYTMDFDSAPPARGAFWSLQTARLDQFAMADALDYASVRDFGYVGYVYGKALTDTTKATSGGGARLATAADGSFRVTLSSRPKPANFTAGAVGNNFLQIAHDAPFYIIFRIYNPSAEVVRAEYKPPPLVRVGGLAGV